MANNKRRIIFFIISKSIILVLSFVCIIFNSKDTFLNYKAAILLASFNAIIDVFELINQVLDKQRIIYKHGSLGLFNTIDRDTIAENVHKEFKERRRVVYINSSKLINSEIENIKQKIYEYLSNDKKINAYMPTVFDFDSINEILFETYQGKKKKSVFIFDYRQVDAFVIKQIEERLLKIELNNKMKKIIDTLCIVYLVPDIYLDGEQKIETNVSLKDIYKLIEKNTEVMAEIKSQEIYNITVINKILSSDVYKELSHNCNNDEKLFITIIMYYLRTGQYVRAYTELVEVKANGTVYFNYLFADCLHLLNRYTFSITTINNFLTNNFCSYEIKKEFELLLAHVLKHLGIFTDNCKNYYANDNFQFTQASNDLYSKYGLISKQMINCYLFSLYEVLKNPGDAVAIFNKKYGDQLSNDIDNKLYLAIVLAQSGRINEALEFIDSQIKYLKENDDRLIYNAYYIKAEILKYISSYEESYEYFKLASGILDDHIDLNLLDQTYFSTKILETLDLVKGNFSERIISSKDLYFNNNYRITGCNDEISYNDEIQILLFNDALIDFLNSHSNDTNTLKKVYLNNLFIIL